MLSTGAVLRTGSWQAYGAGMQFQGVEYSSSWEQDDRKL